jgi:chemotaxis protein histidine kinase CheA
MSTRDGGDGKAQIDAQVDSLGKSFLLRTRDDIARLSDLVNGPAIGDSKVLKELERICHSIHGAGAMFGYRQLSLAAGTMEHLVVDILRGLAATSPTGSPSMPSLIDCTAELARALQAAVRAIPENCMFEALVRES